MLLLRDVARGKHAIEHRVAPFEARVGIFFRIEIRRRLRDAYERGRLGEREIGRRHLEIVLRRRLDAVAAVSVVDGVEVHEQDLVFAESLLHVDGQLGFADLAFERDVGGLVGEDGVAHELLGDGGRAFEVAAGQVVHERAGDAEQIHAVVLVKAHVLGIHRPLEDVRAHLVGALERFALLKAELGEHGGLVARVHDRLLRVVREVDVLDGRQVFRPAFHDAQDALHAPVGDEAQCGSHDKEGPFRAMGALFALFSPYLHDSIILAYR